MTAVYIEWTEEISEFDSWYYVGGGEVDPIFKSKVITKSAKWSDNTSQESIDKAKQFCKTDRPESKVIVK